jgi:undecaprenyl-diphosphatase
VVHGATALSTLVVFWKTIWEIVRDVFKFEWNESTQYVAKIVLSMIPVGIVGVLWKDELEALFDGNVMLVCGMLILTGFLLFFTTRAGEKQGEVTFGKALIVGIAQAIAILPGISRSGATISTALLAGIDRTKAARFSFLMVIPPILGANLLEVKDFMEASEAGVATEMSIGTLPLIVGFVTSFIVGFLACTWMINIVRKGKLIYFAIYCWAVGALGLAYTLLQ